MFRKEFFFSKLKYFFLRKPSVKEQRFISRYQFATAIIVINHKMDEPYNESIDNARAICLESVNRQMMDSTCVSSLIKNSCA